MLICLPRKLFSTYLSDIATEFKRHCIGSHSPLLLTVLGGDHRTKMQGSGTFRQIIPAFVLKGPFLSLRIASLIKCIALELESEKEKRVLPTKMTSKWKLHAWYLVTIVNIAYAAFQCISFSVNVDSGRVQHWHGNSDNSTHGVNVGSPLLH